MGREWFCSCFVFRNTVTLSSESPSDVYVPWSEISIQLSALYIEHNSNWNVTL